VPLAAFALSVKVLALAPIAVTIAAGASTTSPFLKTSVLPPHEMLTGAVITRRKVYLHVLGDVVTTTATDWSRRTQTA
jgi:hypothetical protein